MQGLKILVFALLLCGALANVDKSGEQIVRDAFDRYARTFFLYELAGFVVFAACAAYLLGLFGLGCYGLYCGGCQVYQHLRHLRGNMDIEKKQQ
jgi:hypothetical protein